MKRESPTSIEPMGPMEDGLPLTPALSPREREAGPPPLDKSGRTSTSSQPAILPLPRGEGRGEGNGACPTTTRSRNATPGQCPTKEHQLHRRLFLKGLTGGALASTIS